MLHLSPLAEEGLTNFRQQGFEEDMTSYAVRRIEEARVIRSAQFVQDAGPMAHSVRPESYSAIDNFYTVCTPETLTLALVMRL